MKTLIKRSYCIIFKNTMKCLIIPDKFKGSLTAAEVSNAIVRGLQLTQISPLETIVIPASDGGDGFLDLVQLFKKVRRKDILSLNALQQPIESYYLIDESSKTAYVELANTVGLAHISSELLDMEGSSTKGVGIQILDALTSGVKYIYIGLGGSASTDIGFGLLAGLGFIFKDHSNRVTAYNTSNLSNIYSISASNYLKNLIENCSFYAINDVSNPLFGPHGAAHIFGPQKGASLDSITKIDKAINDFTLSFNFPYLNDFNIAGGGAAGGTAFGLMAFLNASFIKGFDFLNEISSLEALLVNSEFDLIISGEGRFDQSSLDGKLLNGILKLSQSHSIPLLLICGQCDKETISSVANSAICISLLDANTTLESCMSNPSALIEYKIFNFFNK